jgi:hypothetical protein
MKKALVSEESQTPQREFLRHTRQLLSVQIEAHNADDNSKRGVTA